MTALGLAVAVPAVMAYNWLMRRNKAVLEELARFTNDIHGYMMSGGTVRPMATSAAGRAAPGAASPGGTTATGSAMGATTGSPRKV
jgi:biopolymer transport protein ExbB